MSAVFSAHILSESLAGEPIPVIATTSPGDLLHTADATGLDQIRLVVSNTSGSAEVLWVEAGAGLHPITVPANDTVFMEDGEEFMLTGGLELRAYCATTDVIRVGGVVVRYAGEVNADPLMDGTISHPWRAGTTAGLTTIAGASLAANQYGVTTTAAGLWQYDGAAWGRVFGTVAAELASGVTGERLSELVTLTPERCIAGDLGVVGTNYRLTANPDQGAVITVPTPDTDLDTIIINGNAYTYTSGTGTVADIVAGLAADIEASKAGFGDAIQSYVIDVDNDGSADRIYVGSTDGTPFTISVSGDLAVAREHIVTVVADLPDHAVDDVTSAVATMIASLTLGTVTDYEAGILVMCDDGLADVPLYCLSKDTTLLPTSSFDGAFGLIESRVASPTIGGGYHVHAAGPAITSFGDSSGQQNVRFGARGSLAGVAAGYIQVEGFAEATDLSTGSTAGGTRRQAAAGATHTVTRMAIQLVAIGGSGDCTFDVHRMLITREQSP